jgi:hypothetical protein
MVSILPIKGFDDYQMCLLKGRIKMSIFKLTDTWLYSTNKWITNEQY